MNLGPLNSWAEFRCMWRHKSVVAGFCGGGLATPKSHRIFQESGCSSNETSSLDGFTKFGYQTPPNDLLVRSTTLQYVEPPFFEPPLMMYSWCIAGHGWASAKCESIRYSGELAISSGGSETRAEPDPGFASRSGPQLFSFLETTATGEIDENNCPFCYFFQWYMRYLLMILVTFPADMDFSSGFLVQRLTWQRFGFSAIAQLCRISPCMIGGNIPVIWLTTNDTKTQ